MREKNDRIVSIDSKKLHRVFLKRREKTLWRIWIDVVSRKPESLSIGRLSVEFVGDCTGL